MGAAVESDGGTPSLHRAPNTARRDPGSEADNGGVGYGDVLATWGLWALLLAAMAVTYARLELDDLYNVSREGIGGALSRVLVELNYPIAFVAIAIVLIALDTLGGRWWWLGGTAVVACAVAAWPGVVDDGDLDARPVNIVAALGVAASVAMTIAAVRRTGTSMSPRCRFDTARIVIAAVVLFLSLPWLAADIGLYLPDVGFITERPITGSDGAVNPAVHLGHHHGLDGSLLLLSALLLSRRPIRSRALRTVTTGYLSLMAAYGGMNAAQDVWHEQVQKRDWVDWTFPKATEPALAPIWVVILVAAVGIYLLLRQEPSPDTNAVGRG